MVVIYAEKASLAKSIAGALHAGKRLSKDNEPTVGWWQFEFKGEPAIICHGAGHLCENVRASSYGEQYKYWDLEKYPCIPDELKIQVKENTKSCYTIVSEFFNKADWLTNATDPDREGELIFGYIYESLNCKLPWKRVILEDTTDTTIHRAFHNLKDSSEMLPLQYAGRARSYADWIIGINTTVAMTKRFGNKDNILTLGRVQTPTLNLIVQRELAIKNHIGKPFWKLTAEFNVNNEKLYAEYKNGNFEKKSEAEKILLECQNTKNGIVTKKEIKVKKVSSPKLYNATQLRIACNKTFGWSLKEADKTMQDLYEHHLMSYPRSSSEYLPESMIGDITITLNKLFQYMYKQYKIDNWEPFSKRHFDDSKVGSHTAIIPTTNVPENLDNISDNEKKLYDLLVKSIIRIIYPKAEVEETTIEINVSENQFLSRGNKVNSLGWYSVDAIPDKDKNLPNCNEGDVYNGSFNIKEGKTEPPKRYTQATLIADMELAGKKMDDEETRALMLKNHMGLGTEATRTATVQQLFNKGYITEKGKSIYATDKGIYLINTLPVKELKSAKMTGEWEKKLNDIAQGTYSYDKYIEEMKRKTLDWYNQIVGTQADVYKSKDDIFCPFCGKLMKMRDFGLSCTGYKNEKNPCHFSISKEICGKKITQSQMKLLINSGKTGVIKGFVGKSGKEFDASLKLNKETKKINFEFSNSKHNPKQ